MLRLWHRETHINPQRNEQTIVDPAGIKLTTSGLRQHRELPVVQHVRFMPPELRQNQNPNDMPQAALDNWQPGWNAQVVISTPVCINFELRSGARDIHICGFFLMLLHRETQINPQRGVSVDPVGIELTTSRLMQHSQLPVVQHVRFMPPELCQKRNPNGMPEAALDNWQPVWNAQVTISTPVCANFELRPAMAIYIFFYLMLMLWHSEIYINPQRNG